MTGVRFQRLKTLIYCSSPRLRLPKSPSYNLYANFSEYLGRTLLEPSYILLNRRYRIEEGSSFMNIASTRARTLAFSYLVDAQCYRPRPTSPNVGFRTTIPLFLTNVVPHYRSYSSTSSNKTESSEYPRSPTASGSGEADVSNTSLFGNDWLEKVKETWQSVVDAASLTEQKAKDAYGELAPYVQQVLDSHPFVKDVAVPVGITLTASMLAWVVMPKLLRKFYAYAVEGPSRLSGSGSGEQVPYEKTFWGALEDPLRYLITFIAFSQIAMIVAPTTVASQYASQAWRGAVIISFIWFLYRWKSNLFSRALAYKNLSGLERERLLALDRISSIGLFIIGLMASAEACGVAVNSILTVGGIGGVATAFAAKDILGNVLSGLSMQFFKPFSLGDTIKAGSIEGQVVDMGLTTTSLLNAEKFPVIVPNSLFSSQIIINKSRAQWRAIITKIPLNIDDVSKITRISNDIKSMLRSHPKVFLGKENPYCFLSRIESYYAELTLGCNLRQMSKDEFYSTEQDILLQSVRIIKEHGGRLGCTSPDAAR